MDLSAALLALYEHDYESAYPDLRQAADANDPDACLYLGKMYLLGHYVQQSDEYAFHLIKKAAEKKRQQAQRLLSEMYAEGKGCKSSKRKAMQWLTKAAKGGCPDAAIRLAQHYIDGAIVKRNYNIALYWLGRNKPHEPLFLRRLMNRFIEPQEERREHIRTMLKAKLYLSFVYWRLLTPLARKLFK